MHGRSNKKVAKPKKVPLTISPVVEENLLYIFLWNYGIKEHYGSQAHFGVAVRWPRGWASQGQCGVLILQVFSFLWNGIRTISLQAINVQSQAWVIIPRHRNVLPFGHSELGFSLRESRYCLGICASLARCMLNRCHGFACLKAYTLSSLSFLFCLLIWMICFCLYLYWCFCLCLWLCLCLRV